MRIPKGIIWIDWWEIYQNWNEATWSCKAIHDIDNWFTVLNIKIFSEGISIKCWHILKWWNCEYLSHVKWWEERCPLTQIQGLEVIPQTKIKAA